METDNAEPGRDFENVSCSTHSSGGHLKRLWGLCDRYLPGEGVNLDEQRV
jgi:hypothetical protein